MKVICIDAEAWPNDLPEFEEGLIENGEVYDVIDVYFEDGYIWYELSFNPDFGYWENCFARCSNIDEREISEQRKQLSTTNE